MISFKVTSRAHESIRIFFKIFYGLTALAICVIFLLIVAGSYQKARFILADYTSLTVHLTLQDVEEGSGRRSSSDTYIFTYTFDAQGKRYQGSLDASESYAEELFAQGLQLEIAYANANPSQFDRLSLLQRQSKLSGAAIRWIITSLIVMLIALILYAFTTMQLFVDKDRPVDDEKENADA
ncbi:DUF3592 domain-containing protein [Saezia sanguinis]|uniref:DUF3592 domain-containing protein n=1 Tax=Saezia sanguinis TaxID=1965230 RepID=UPI00302B7357